MPIWKVLKRKEQEKTLLLMHGAAQPKKAYALKLLEAKQNKKGKENGTI